MTQQKLTGQNEAGQTIIQVTPDMIKAGEAELALWRNPLAYGQIDDVSGALAAVYIAMARKAAGV